MFPSLVEKLELVVVHYLQFVVHGSVGGFFTLPAQTVVHFECIESYFEQDIETGC